MGLLRHSIADTIAPFLLIHCRAPRTCSRALGGTGAVSDGRRRVLPRTAPALGGLPIAFVLKAGTGPCDGVPPSTLWRVSPTGTDRCVSRRTVRDGRPTIAGRASATLPLTFGVLRVLCHFASTVRSSPTFTVPVPMHCNADPAAPSLRFAIECTEVHSGISAAHFPSAGCWYSAAKPS